MIRNLEIGKRLMLITHRTEHYTEYEEAEMFLQGGGRWVQLRMKQGLDLEMTKRIATLCAKYDALFCIDDDVQMALACSASAVHLGKNDMPIAEAKAIVEAANPEKPFWIGATANTFEDIKKAARQGASYIGLGPFRFTQTKQKLSPGTMMMRVPTLSSVNELSSKYLTSAAMASRVVGSYSRV